MQKKDIKPLIEQLLSCNSNTELETLKIWFLELLNSIDGITEVESRLHQSQGSISVYNFCFEYNGVKFNAQTLPPSKITIQTLGLIHFLDANGDYLTNVLKLASAIARELKSRNFKS
jgi:hypothetical protein